MNELRRILEDALSAAPPDSDTRELVGQALDMLDTIPMEPLEIMAEVERVKAVLRGDMQSPGTDAWRDGVSFGLALALEEIGKEFPDAKE